MGNGGKIPRVEPGKPILTRSINGIVNAVNRLRMMEVTPPLSLADGPQGPTIQKDVEPGFWARLTGNSGNAYSYQEVVWQGGTTVDVTGGRTGTTSTRPAYEVNGITTLASGWVDFLRPGAPGEYVFQSVKYGSAGCSGTVTLTFLCGSTPVSGVSVTIAQGATSYTGTTNGSGQVTFSPGVSGTWTVTATKAGYVTVNSSFVFSCTNLLLTFGIANNSTSVTGNVKACGVNVVGATVTVSDASGVVATTTTDASGNFSTGLIGHNGTTLTIAASGYRLTTGTVTRSVSCGASTSVNFSLSAATGDRCLCSGKIGSATTLNFTSSGYSTTLTYGTGPASGSSAYVGTFTVSCRSINGGGCAKGTATVTMTVEFVPTCGLAVYFNRVANAAGTTVCSTPAIRSAPVSDAYCATLPAFPGGPTCRLDTQSTNGDLPTLVSAVGGPISATPFAATFTGILFRDADDTAVLTDAVVSE